MENSGAVSQSHPKRMSPGLQSSFWPKQNLIHNSHSFQIFFNPGINVLSHSVLSDSFGTPWAVAPRLLCPGTFPGKNTGAGCHFLLQGLSPTQGSNLDLLHCRHRFFAVSATREVITQESTDFLMFNPSSPS